MMALQLCAWSAWWVSSLLQQSHARRMSVFLGSLCVNVGNRLEQQQQQQQQQH